MALPERKRIQRARQNSKFWHLLNDDGTALLPVEPSELAAIAEVLKQFPVSQ